MHAEPLRKRPSAGTPRQRRRTATLPLTHPRSQPMPALLLPAGPCSWLCTTWWVSLAGLVAYPVIIGVVVGVAVSMTKASPSNTDFTVIPFRQVCFDAAGRQVFCPGGKQ